MFHILEHPTAGPVKVLAPPVSLDGEGFRPGPPTPALGTETQAILEALGFSAKEVEDLIEANVTHSGS
jgi:crotonobetainyl-CoA:carnitine CoA-transferase CaiB-like acyl-CoA transferase